MNSFRSGLDRLLLPTGTAWLLSDIAESKGQQQLFTRQSPQVLKALVELALVQSVESSNRIEGVTVAPERLRPLVVGHARPRDRSEEEIQGYRRALHWIHTAWPKIEITPDTLRRLHAVAQEGAGDAGHWKRRDNEIVELRPGRAPLVRFRPVAAAATPAAVDELCTLHAEALDVGRVPSLVVTAALVFDLLCIHPFRDGNGRVARLLTLLALYQHGHEVGRYISLERLVEDTRDDYYAVLHQSSEGWHKGKHDLLPWLNYLLSIVRRAYRLFEERAGEVKASRGAKTELVRTTIEALDADFTLTELERRCPGVSHDMLRRVLRDLRRDGRLTCLGRGPAARWTKEGNTLKRG